MSSNRAVVVFALAFAACARDSASASDAGDAGDDSAVLDAGTDSALRDTGSTSDGSDTESSAGDLGTDGETGGPPWIGAWKPIPGAPSECGDVLAVDPSVSVPPLQWIPCPSGRPGCRVLEVDWSIAGTTSPAAKKTQFLDFPEHEPIRLIGGKPFFTYMRVWAVFNVWSYELFVAQPVDGAAVAAFREDWDAMRAGKACFGEMSAGEAGIELHGGSLAHVDSYYASWSSWSAPNTFTTLAGPSTTFGMADNGFLSVAVGERSLFIEPVVPESVSLLDMSTSKVNPAKLPSQDPLAVHGGAVARDYRAPYAVSFIDDAGTLTDVIPPESGRVPTWHAIDRANGDAFVWFESDDTVSFGNPTIWTAPYTTSPGAVTKTKVAVITEASPGGGWGTIANAGMALSMMDSSARLTRLSDGVGWSIAPEPGEHVAWPLWVDDDEVIVFTQYDTMPGVGFPTGIMRLRRDSLAAPDLGRGF